MKENAEDDADNYDEDGEDEEEENDHEEVDEEEDLRMVAQDPDDSPPSFCTLLDQLHLNNKEVEEAIDRNYDEKELLKERVRYEIQMYKKIKPITIASLLETKTLPMEWWPKHESLFPCLANVARDVLAIPATSAAVERLFSKAELIIDYLSTNTKSEVVSSMVTIGGTLPIIKQS